MNSLGHLAWSILKSLIRMIGAIIAVGTKTVYPLALAIFSAEIAGIIEEMVDKR